MSDDVTVRIVGEDAASPAFESATRSLGGFRETAEGASRSMGSWKDSLDSVDGALGQLGTSITGVLGYLKQSIDQGDALNDIMGQMGGASNEAARSMTQGLIPALDLAQARGRALAAGLQLTDQQFAAVAAAAQVYALRTGTDGAAAVERLSNALVSGSERALRPFGIRLEEGATRSQNTAAALAQLSAAADANAANVARSTGAWDRLGTVFDVAKEKMSALHAFTFGLIDGVGRLTTLVEDCARAIGSGDANGLATALNDAGEEGQQLVAQLPVIGSAAAAATSGVRGLANTLLDAARAQGLLSYRIAQAATAEQRAAVAAGGPLPVPTMGGRLLLDRGLDQQGYAARLREIDERRRDASRAEVERQRYEDAMGGGGGGGGGAANDDRWGISQREIERINRQNAERAQAMWGSGGEYQQAVQSDPRSRLSWIRESNSERRGALGREGQERAARGMTNAVERQQTAYERLGERGEAVLSSLNSAWESHFAAFSKGEESFGKAMRGMAAAALESLALQSLKEAGFQTAKGIAALASFNYGGAALHFAAAAAFGLVAGGAYAGSAAIAPASSSARSGGSEFRTPTSSTSLGQRSANDGGGPPINIYLSPGAIVGVGGGDQHAAGNWLADQIEGAHLRRNRQRRIRDAA